MPRLNGKYGMVSQSGTGTAGLLVPLAECQRLSGCSMLCTYKEKAREEQDRHEGDVDANIDLESVRFGEMYDFALILRDHGDMLRTMFHVRARSISSGSSHIQTRAVSPDLTPSSETFGCCQIKAVLLSSGHEA